MNLTAASLTSFMESRLGVDATGVNDKTLLFSSNLLYSFIIVELIAFIEVQAGIRVEPWDVSLDNLDSIERILRYVQSKQGEPR